MSEVDQLIGDLWKLREKLRQVLEMENFDDAARLRNEVRKMEDALRRRKMEA